MDHHDSCGCGCGHEHHHREHRPADTAVTENQAAFLHQLSHNHYLPVARFVAEDSRQDDFSIIALAPVFLRSAADEMDTVKEAGAFLKKLEDMGLITLDYDIPLDGYAYDEYKGSALYAYFCDTVREGAKMPDFMGDTPILELGSMALTEAGEKIAAEHCGHGEHHHH
ncbi:MAG: hypothetical protein EOM52_12005 [Clostridia bacterium]|nr:hypothetical protein [Clostridia bacterium]